MSIIFLIWNILQQKIRRNNHNLIFIYNIFIFTDWLGTWSKIWIVSSKFPINLLTIYLTNMRDQIVCNLNYWLIHIKFLITKLIKIKFINTYQLINKNTEKSHSFWRQKNLISTHAYASWSSIWSRHYSSIAVRK